METPVSVVRCSSTSGILGSSSIAVDELSLLVLHLLWLSWLSLLSVETRKKLDETHLTERFAELFWLLVY